ncbi:MAG TPA: BMP family ABC transporter substrate-binding protein [Gaiellaceae bacterium]|nr:BMP family ABC transporter substrate-binding protein [Gaiellaceae bacterium]
MVTTVRRSLLLLGFCALLAACGGSSKSSSSTTTAAATSLKVGLVTDIGGLNDRGFNQLSYQGLQRAEKQLGVKGRVLLSKSNADYVPNLSTLAKQHYDLVVAVGFLMTDAVDTVAQKFPQTHFAIIDVDQASLPHKPKNVEGLLFREQQGGYLIGYLAGLVVKGHVAAPGGSSGGKPVVGVVGGQSIPPVNRFAAGYEAGAKAADPGITVKLDYSQDFVDQGKCKEIALNQIAAGAKVIFADAGACGLGALDAAKEQHVWGLGGDADESYLGPHILSSELKKVDVAVYKTIQAVKSKAFKGGTDAYFDVQNGGVGIGKISPKVPQSIVAKVQAAKQKIGSGKIANIPTTPTAKS